MATKRKNWLKMTAAELAEATKEFDGPIDESKLRPMTAVQRAKFEKLRRGPGRPVVGQGAAKVLISVERTLLKKLDAAAKKRKVSRSEFIATAVNRAIAAA